MGEQMYIIELYNKEDATIEKIYCSKKELDKLIINLNESIYSIRLISEADTLNFTVDSFLKKEEGIELGNE